MKKTNKILPSIIFSFFSFALILAGCAAHGSGGGITSESAENAAPEMEAEARAFSVLRELGNLGPFCMEEEEDENGNTVKTALSETLPDNWKTITLEADIGKKAKGEQGTRLVPVFGVDDAAEYVSSIIGEVVEAKDASWNFTDLGTLSFKINTDATSKIDEFATLEVAIRQIPDLKKVKFVSVTYFEANSAENKYSGESYYSAGDIIQKNKDKTIWMCVRPSGGDLKKDYCYWICLDPFVKNKKGEQEKSSGLPKTLFETKVSSGYKLYTWMKNTTIELPSEGDEPDVVYQKMGRMVGETVKWTYAKNLMTLKTAKAAYHTLNAISTNNVGDELKSRGYDLMELGWKAKEGTPSSEARFCIAYGKPIEDKKRNISKSPINAQLKLVQPFLVGETKGTANDIKEYITLRQDSEDHSTDFLYSATDDYDYKFLTSNYQYEYVQKVKAARKQYFEDTYDFRNFLYKHEPDGFKFVNSKGEVDYSCGWHKYKTSEEEQPIRRVIFSPELSFKDNNDGNKPSDGKYFTEIYRQKANGGAVYDWWASLKKTTRYVDGKEVKWNKENE